MITTGRKTTKTTNVITWSTVLKDDSGTQFATMTGTLDAAHPFGSTSLTVHNQSLFTANEAAAKAAYEGFQGMVAETVGTIQPSIVTVAGDADMGDTVSEGGDL